MSVWGKVDLVFGLVFSSRSFVGEFPCPLSKRESVRGVDMYLNKEGQGGSEGGSGDGSECRVSGVKFVPVDQTACHHPS